jgi:hypothetical protein
VLASYANWPAANEVTANPNYGELRHLFVTRLSPVLVVVTLPQCHNIPEILATPWQY